MTLILTCLIATSRGEIWESQTQCSKHHTNNFSYGRAFCQRQLIKKDTTSYMKVNMYYEWVLSMDLSRWSFFFIVVLLFLVRGTVEEDGSWMSEWLVFVMCFFFLRKSLVMCLLKNTKNDFWIQRFLWVMIYEWFRIFHFKKLFILLW